MKVDANFVTSAAGADDVPRDGLFQIVLVGRSNVGKSSLINALVRQRLARTSAAPGKTRLANIYRVARGSGRPLYVVDLPGYGYARGGAEGRQAFDTLAQAFFGPQREPRAALLLVDARHPGLDSDRAAWAWLLDTAGAVAIVATKVDKLSRAERQRAIQQLEAVFQHPVLPVSAATGEGLDELWILIDTLANPLSRKPPHSRRGSSLRPAPLPEATARPPRKR